MNRAIARAGLHTALVTIIAAGLCLPAAAGTLYRWVDARGVVNYSSEPPPAGAPAQAVTQHAMTSYDATAALAAAERQNRELQVRLDRLQREVDELKARNTQVAAAPAAQPVTPQRVTAANPCDSDPRINCSRGSNPEFDYPPGTVERTVGIPVYIVPQRPQVPITPGTVTPRNTHRSSASNGSGLSVNLRF